MANYLSLEEAAQKLGIPTDRLVELRSQGEIRGFRDGSSWKFPEDEIERLAAGGLASGDSHIIGGDAGGSDVELGSGSDVNLIASEGEGSDVAVVAGDSGDLIGPPPRQDLEEIDSADLQLEDPAILKGSDEVDIAIEPNAGSTGPVTDQELEAISQSHPDVLAPESGQGSSTSNIDVGADAGDVKLSGDSDLSFTGAGPDDDSDDEILGGDEDSAMDVLGSDIALSGSGAEPESAGMSDAASSLEMLGQQLGEGGGEQQAGRGSDVLSELDLLSAEQQGSGIISGDSENLLKSSGLGSSIGADGFKDSDLSGLDDALADDDDLVIADDDDDLVISGADSDISVAGDSGINLMSPSDSGLSLESEPLDLAGSSISALDLGAELSEGGSSGSGVGSGGGSDGSMVDFQADEEFQLSPSGIGSDADIESGSQVIEVEDSEAIGEPVEFGEAGFDAEPVDEGLALDEDSVGLEAAVSTSVGASRAAYEINFSLLQCVSLMMVLILMAIGGMLMTDLVRNMWAYAEPSAPVSSLTDALINLMGW